MRIYSLLFLIVVLSTCAETTSENIDIKSKDVQKPEFQKILDDANVAGSILLYDLKEDTYFSNDFEYAKKTFIPASTFKIPNSLIALETGIVKDAETVMKWDGTTRFVDNWNKDLTFREAFHYSCVPCYQEIARSI